MNSAMRRATMRKAAGSVKYSIVEAHPRLTGINVIYGALLVANPNNGYSVS